MVPIKEHVAKTFVGQKLHFKCDCMFPLDFVGVIKGYDVRGEEIIFKVESKGKIVDIGLNHPKLTVEKL